VVSWLRRQDFSPEPERHLSAIAPRRGAWGNDRDPRGRPLIRPSGLDPSSLARLPLEGPEGAEHRDEQEASSTSSATTPQAAPRPRRPPGPASDRGTSSAQPRSTRNEIAPPANQRRRRAYPSDRAAR